MYKLIACILFILCVLFLSLFLIPILLKNNSEFLKVTLSLFLFFFFFLGGGVGSGVFLSF